MRADGKLLAIVPCMLGLLPKYIMDLPLIHFEAQSIESLYRKLTHCGEYCLYTRQMPKGYKSSENFSAVGASNVIELYKGIAKAGLIPVYAILKCTGLYVYKGYFHTGEYCLYAREMPAGYKSHLS